jgi:hypothetical protein
MVRFSDMLGGNDEERTVPEVVEPGYEPEVEVVELAGSEQTEASPEDLLDRLTQYATSARAADQVAPKPASDPGPSSDEQGNTEHANTEPGRADDLSPVGDDFLPKAKRGKRRD